jgi:uncharacterized protein YdeI (YjbR/CyaY-like superfamily)
MSKRPLEALERVEIGSRAQWRAWLEHHCSQQESIWLVSWKKGRGPSYVPYGELRDEALCFGWIDSRSEALDADRSMLLMSPRRAGSGWSLVNKQRVTALINEGQMTSAGLAIIDAARQDGSWFVLDAAGRLDVPNDLQLAFTAYGNAAENFAAFPPSSRRAILEWIALAKLPTTRARRVEKTACLAGQGRRAL